VVRQAVAAHGGTITAHVRPEGGAEFVIDLPASPAAATDHGAGDAAEAAGT
jgi:signal transduction histidine kinase